MAGTITQEDRTFVEHWESVTHSTVFIVKVDARGYEVSTPVPGKQTVLLTTEDRIITEGRILEAKNNPFRNGQFRPLVVPDGVTVETNPNAISDEEIATILTCGKRAWAAHMERIDAQETIRRMIDIADAGEVDVSLLRYRELQDRLQGPQAATSQALQDFAKL